MNKQIISSPIDSTQYLEWIKEVVSSGISDDIINSIKMTSKCTNCGKWCDTTRISFSDNLVSVKSNGIKCNIPEQRTYKQKFSVEGMSKEEILVLRESDFDFHQTYIYLLVGGYLRVPLSSTYSSRDFEVHGEYVYKDRKIETTSRIENNNTLIIEMQNFVDFKGLVPEYTDKIVIKFNCPIYF